jgi:hypothetical protein
VDFSSPSWQTPAQIGECRRTGAVAVLAGPLSVLNNFPAACAGTRTQFDVPAMSGMGKARFPVTLVYIPPEKAPIAACGSSAP